MKYVVKTHFGYRATARANGMTRNIGTFRNPERASIAVRLYQHWLKKFQDSDIPRKPMHPDSLNEFGF